MSVQFVRPDIANMLHPVAPDSIPRNLGATRIVGVIQLDSVLVILPCDSYLSVRDLVKCDS